MAVAKTSERNYTITLDLNLKDTDNIVSQNESLETPVSQQKNVGVNKTPNTVSKGALAANLALQQGKKVASAALTNYGNFTGDYIAQSNLETAINIGGELVGMGVAFAAGGLAGLAVAAVGSGVSHGIQAYNIYANRAKQDYLTNMARQRVGLDSFL